MLKTTLGQLLVNDVLPKDLQDYSRTLDKKNTGKLFQEIAARYPDQYRDIAKKLSDIGRKASTESGGFSFGLDSLTTPDSVRRLRQELQQQIDRVLDDKTLDTKAKQDKIVQLTSAKTKEIQDKTYEEAVNAKNPLAMQVISGARGNPGNLRSVLAGDLLYEDHKNRVIPIPVLRSYSEGLTPAEYWAGSYGARKGVVDLKLATADAGYFGKQLNQITHRLLVNSLDDDKYDKSTVRGVPMNTDDPDNEGAFLAHDVGGFKRNTQLTPKVLAELKAKGHDKILVRSPLVGGHPDGGLYAYDVGVRERGGLPAPGDNVGMAAAQSLSEQTSQSQICLAEGTLVRMANWSTKPIEQVSPGDYVMSLDQNDKLITVKVLRRYDNGVRDCVKTKFRVGRGHKQFVEVVSTPDHKFYAEVNGKKGMFPVGTDAKTFCPVMIKDGCDVKGAREPYALLLGLLLGDGCYTKAVNVVNFSCHDDALVVDTKEYLHKLNMKLRPHTNYGYYQVSMLQDDYYTNRDPITGRMLTGSRNPIKKRLEELGMMHKYAHEKTIPVEAYKWDNESVAQLLSGLFVTDGSVYRRNNKAGLVQINFASTSKRLVEQVVELLLWRFGIRCSRLHINSYGDRKRPLYYINITTIENIWRFYKSIPLYGVKKKKIAELAPEMLNYRMDPGIDKFHRVSQEFVGPVHTYDIEVDHPDHKFLLATSLVVSNSSKHLGGVAGAGGSISGFKYINQLVQIPKTFTGGATHADVDGKVSAVYAAPAGGKYALINGKRHFIHPGQESSVKPGDIVEAGDTISTGLPNPSKIVEHKGVGEGRRYFVDVMRKMYQDSGLKAHRRNIELLSRGLINHVELDEEIGDFVPGDKVSYDVIEHSYQPRPDHRVTAVRSANGQYLEKPVLHYTIGTRIQPSMIREMERFGVKNVMTHKEPPPFRPVMIQGRYNLLHDQDWMTRQLGMDLKKGLLDSAHRGLSSDPTGSSFVPALAEAKNFGRQGLTKSWDPKQVIKTQVIRPEHEQYEEYV